MASKVWFITGTSEGFGRVWAIGLLVGINLVFGGTAVIAKALHARRLA